MPPAPAAGAALASVSGPPMVAAEVSAAVRHPPVATLAVVQADISNSYWHGCHADMHLLDDGLKAHSPATSDLCTGSAAQRRAAPRAWASSRLAAALSPQMPETSAPRAPAVLPLMSMAQLRLQGRNNCVRRTTNDTRLCSVSSLIRMHF